jgi:hypothetical protein
MEKQQLSPTTIADILATKQRLRRGGISSLDEPSSPEGPPQTVELPTSVQPGPLLWEGELPQTNIDVRIPRVKYDYDKLARRLGNAVGAGVAQEYQTLEDTDIQQEKRKV